MNVFIFGMTLAALLLGSAAEVDTPFLLWANVFMSLILMVGAVAGLFTKRDKDI
jgi:hypothetical protein